MAQDIILDVIGNTSPFSLMGESSGYMVTVNGSTYLLECGSPVFPVLGYKGIGEIRGIFASHSHEDHKRWFTDIVLFSFYNPIYRRRLRLITSEVILEEFAKNSKGALERSLSRDSKRIVDMSYEKMVDGVIIGPRSKYFIKLKSTKVGRFQYVVEGRDGNEIGPEKAKLFINPIANRPRLLFKDDEMGEWIEPESYYPFSSTSFYEENQNIHYDDEAGLAIKAVKSSVWHGVPTIGFKFMTDKSRILFSADTVYNPKLWKELYEEYRPQRFDRISREEFEESSILYGNINDFIERTWSRQRYESAMSAYDGSFVIHDVARKNSIVHTDYADIANAAIPNLLFTHNPDNLVAWRPILTSGKKLAFRDGSVFESVKGKLYRLDADIYIHHFSCDLVGYSSKKGDFKVIEKDGLLGIVDNDSQEEGLLRVNLYQDIAGEYYPILTDPNKFYRSRPDGKVEEVTVHKDSSSGVVVNNKKERQGL